MYYVQFLHRVGRGFGEAGGTLGTYILDGRKSLHTMHAMARHRASVLQNIVKFDAYTIVKSDGHDFRTLSTADLARQDRGRGWTFPEPLTYPTTARAEPCPACTSPLPFRVALPYPC